MQAVTVTLAGDFWDVQIYRGRLYLWDVDGRIAIYNWDAIVDRVADFCPSRLAATLAFSRGDALYKIDPVVSTSEEFRSWLEPLFDDISKRDFTFSESDLRKYLIGEQDNPFRELPSATEIYWNILYATDDSGLWSASVHRAGLKHPISTRPQRLWSAPLYSVSAYGRRLVLAAGDEGLFEYDLGPARPRLPTSVSDRPDAPERVDSDVLRLSPWHCSEAQWAFSSVYGVSSVSGGYLVAFDWLRESPDGYFLSGRDELLDVVDHPVELRYVRSYREADILSSNQAAKFSWAGQDKIYAARDGVLDVVRFTQRNLSEPDISAFEQLGSIRTRAAGAVVSGRVAYFGTILETEESLTVMLSDQEQTEIEGPITRWRVYPRAIRYENHLHVVLDDRLVIYSFNNDYMVDQETKLSGIRYSPPRPRRQR